MRRYLIASFTLIALAGASKRARSQVLPPGPIGEPPECAIARQMAAQRRVPEARNWQRACQEKRRAAAVRSAAPVGPRYKSPPAMPPTGPAPTAAPPVAKPLPGAMQPARDPNAPESPGCAQTSEGCRWMAELPSAGSVMKAYQGSDAEAALAVLRDYLHKRSGIGDTSSGGRGWHPRVWGRMLEYLQAVQPDVPFGQLSESTYTLRGRAKELFQNVQFKVGTLSKFVSPESLAVYEQSPEFKEIMAGQAETSPGFKLDKDEARKHGTDLSVFGINLGDPLNLPICGTNDPSSLAEGLTAAFVGSSVPETCVTTEAAGMLTFVSQFSGASETAIPWVSSGTSVKIARKKCPNWLVPGGCTLILNVQNGIPMGAFFSTAGVAKESAIESALSAKYHASGRKNPNDRGIVCRNNLTSIVTSDTYYARYWDPHGLHIMYMPLTNCNIDTGTVVVEFSRVRQAHHDKERRREESQPKM